MLVSAVGLVALLVLFLVMPASRFGSSNLTSDLLGHGEDHSHRHRPWYSGFYNSIHLAVYPRKPV
ncbi:hypothetical protein E2C01_075487 [Portunus trituberculatus]|uniref:Uncharacterized protein n=1 Tax=Portunus trituberculatus TaxID=210409 RepID=A0A5B7I8Q3_PORTR|nr:hypothetical protein [Portunus trituberculatus]